MRVRKRADAMRSSEQEKAVCVLCLIHRESIISSGINVRHKLNRFQTCREKKQNQWGCTGRLSALHRCTKITQDVRGAIKREVADRYLRGRTKEQRTQHSRALNWYNNPTQGCFPEIEIQTYKACFFGLFPLKKCMDDYLKPCVAYYLIIIARTRLFHNKM